MGGWVERAESEPLETQAREEAGAREGIRERANDEAHRFRAMTTKWSHPSSPRSFALDKGLKRRLKAARCR